MAKVKAKAVVKAGAKGTAKAPAKGKGMAKAAAKAPATVTEILKGKPKFKTIPTVAAGPAVKATGKAMAPATGKAKTPKSPKVVDITIPAQVLPIGDPAAIAPEVATRMDEMVADVLTAQTRDANGLPWVAPSDWVAPHPVGATVRVPIESVDMDPAHNGRVLDLGKVKEYAADFAKRIAAGTEPQLQECTGFYPVGGNQLRLVFGFHRAAAVKAYNDKHAGKVGAPMLLRVRVVDEMTATQALLDNWAENKHHNALTPVAEMRYMVRLRDAHGMEQKAIAKTLGVSPTLVSLRLLLERLAPAVLAMVEEGTLPVKSAYMLAGIEDEGKRATAVEKVVAVFAGLGNEGVVKGLKLPKTAIVAQAVAEATGAGAGVTAQVTPPAADAPAPTPADNPNAPRRLSVGKIETTLVDAVKNPSTPVEVRGVLRAVLGWVLGQRTPAAMVGTVAKALGYDPKRMAGAAGGGGGILPGTPTLLEGVPGVVVPGAGVGAGVVGGGE